MSDITHNKVGVTTPEEITNGSDEPVATITNAANPANEEFVRHFSKTDAEIAARDAHLFSRPEADTHAEQRMRMKERSGHVVAVVDVPAHQAEVSLGHSAIEGCAAAAAEAWDSIEKAKDDADFAHSTGQWRQHLINVAESVYASGVTTEGDTAIAKFERAVAKIKARQEKEKADATKAA